MQALFKSAVALAHHYWSLLLQADDTAIDATCGNGQDTLFLTTRLTKGCVIALDIQQKAIEATRACLGEDQTHVHLFLQSHLNFPSLAFQRNIKLIVYNLGYLPGGGVKTLTTETSVTLESVHNALALIVPGGMVSLTCYPGHSEGAREEIALLDLAKKLDPHFWSVCHHKWLNRNNAPSLLLIQKNLTQLTTKQDK